MKCGQKMAKLIALTTFILFLASAQPANAQTEYANIIRDWLKKSEANAVNNGLVDYVEALDMLGNEFNDLVKNNEKLIETALNGTYQHHRNLGYLYQAALPSVQKIMVGNAKAFKHPGWKDIGNTPEQAVLPNFITMSNLNKIMILMSKYHESNGDIDKALSGYINLIYFMNRLATEDNPLLISRLVEIENQKLAYTQLNAFITRNDLSTDQYQMLKSFLQKVEEEELGTINCLENELEVIKWAFSNPRNTQGFKEVAKALEDVNKYKLVNLANEFQKLMVAAYGKPYNDWMLFDKTIKDEELAELLGVEEASFSAFLPNWREIKIRENILITQRRQLMLKTALYAYYKENNHYPDSLTALSMDAFTQDPFANATMVYQPKENGATIYSVGPNMQDEQAAENYDIEKGLITPGDIIMRIGVPKMN